MAQLKLWPSLKLFWEIIAHPRIMAHGRSDFWEVAYVLREVVKYFTKSGRNVGSTTWKLEKNRKSLWNWRIRKWQKRNGHFWWITVIDKKNYLVNKKILVEIIARTRIMAQLELRPTSKLRVFIIARALNWHFTVCYFWVSALTIEVQTAGDRLGRGEILHCGVRRTLCFFV